MERKPYPTDVTDAQWALIAPLIPPAKPGGRPHEVDRREGINALFYLTRSGCAWRLPHDFPPWSTVHDYYRPWRVDGTWQRLHGTLRGQVRDASIPQQAGRDPDPSAALLDLIILACEHGARRFRAAVPSPHPRGARREVGSSWPGSS